jgi:hypothetical protein
MAFEQVFPEGEWNQSEVAEAITERTSASPKINHPQFSEFSEKVNLRNDVSERMATQTDAFDGRCPSTARVERRCSEFCWGDDRTLHSSSQADANVRKDKAK